MSRTSGPGGRPKGFKANVRPDLYAATPPLEVVKLIMSEVASSSSRRRAVGVIDVRRAYFYAPARRRVFVELPPGDWQEGDENVRGLLKASLYGTRDAAQNW